jgi:Dyp-type peroxidase family
MAKVKYHAGVRAAQEAQLANPINRLEPFDFGLLDAGSSMARISSTIAQKLLGPLYAFSRAFMPVMPLAGLLHVTRDEPVRDILLRPDDFQTPFGPEMAEMGNGATFLLGLEGAEHDRLHAIVQKIIRREDGQAIATMSRDFAEALLLNSAGRIDVVGDLIKRVPSEICLRYFGLNCDDVDAFGDWTMAVSALLFGDPYGKVETRKLAMNATKRLQIVIDDALHRNQRLFRRGQLPQGSGTTLIERLVLLQQEMPVTDAEIRAILLGLATGFIPTNTLAATRMLEVLLDRPEAMAMARDAAIGDDLPAMRKIVFEAGRLNPALAPGQWRYCPNDTTLTIDGREKRIKAGQTLLVSTMSAMRDKRAVKEPKRFWPDRTGPDGNWQEPDLVFGIGPHVCMGKHLAVEQISALFSVLLKQSELKVAKGKAGKMQVVGPFPRRMDMTFKTPNAEQSMFIVMMRALPGQSKAQIDAEIARLGNPAGQAMRGALDATGIVHFSSLATIDHEDGIEVAWELSVDGSQKDAIVALARECGALLQPILGMCGMGKDMDTGSFIARHVVKLHGKPWGANGLNYNGMNEFAVKTTDKQAQFSDFVERVLAEFLGSEANRGSHAMLALTYVRRILNQDRILALTATPSERALMDEAAAKGLDAFQHKPSQTELKLADFKTPTMMGSLMSFLGARDGLVITIPALALMALFSWMFLSQDPSVGYFWRYIGTGLRALLATAFTLSALTLAFFLAIRRAEKKDFVDNSQASIEHIAAIGQAEDAPGYAQNHILAIGEMKPGFLRAFAHAFALWAIRMIITYNYRPGFVINMGTIHYARWWRVPGTNKTAFYSNFNGSWESYLEDFITRARWGQTAVWSNWRGFPLTKFLVFNGAEQGDNFKRWVRTKQQIVPFWYSRFPALTTDQIRNNALVHTGVARARSNSEAKEWLRCFGSMPRVENLIESDEVQAIVFSGMKRLPNSATLTLKLPTAPLLGEWLSWIRGQTQALDNVGASENAGAIGGLLGSGVIVPVYARDGSVQGYSLIHSLTLTFGDRPLVGDASVYDNAPDPINMSDAAFDSNILAPKSLGTGDVKHAARRAVFLGLSAAGMAHFAPPNASRGSLLDGFPPAFRMGMAKRGRILGDAEKGAADWRWSDADAEAVLTVYAETPDDLAFVIEIHRALLENYGGRIIHQLDCAPADAHRPEFEHFGYRDGIAQPAIRGTGRAKRAVPSRDLLEPGEFILGYKNGAGYFPPSPVLPAEADMGRILPILSDGEMGRFPDFGDQSIGSAPRDFGRNGTFIVIRELAQDVDGFERFVERKARELRGDEVAEGQMVYRDLYKLIGQFPDKDWVKAKLMGRWPNGRPLIGNPVNTASPKPGDPDEAQCRAAELENDFAFGSDDPQGLACPFGSHIRRTNPRDSKQPGDAKEQIISNRHRLLRRGRSYTRIGADGAAEKGLLFVSVCADLERQFEFVQQAWSNAPSFHGLTNEPDPIFSTDTIDTKTGDMCPRQFTIPTPAGPIKLTGMQNFVTVKAGGYFFLPSRSALTWLTDVSLRKPFENNEIRDLD